MQWIFMSYDTATVAVSCCFSASCKAKLIAKLYHVFKGGLHVFWFVSFHRTDLQLFIMDFLIKPRSLRKPNLDWL